MRHIKRRTTALLAVVFICSFIVSGCGGGIAALLKIAGVSALVPSSWSAQGGIVKIIADIVTANALERVIARIERKGTSEIREIILTRNADGKFEGSFQAPENTSEAAPTTYTAVVTASDSAGNTATSDPITVEVPPAEELQ